MHRPSPSGSGAGPAIGDPAFASWAGATASHPLKVHDLSGRQSYWLVPVRAGNRTVGAVRVRGDGRVSAVLLLREGSAITSIDAVEARHRAAAAIDREGGERIGETLLLHDGPPGREAWRVEVLKGARPIRWIFVTPGGVYQRGAESRSGADDEL